MTVLTATSQLRPVTRIAAEAWEDLPTWPEPLTTEETALNDTEPARWLDHAAHRGAAALREYAERHDRSEPLDTALSDMLADLMHAADALGLDLGAALDQARATYSGDRNPF